MFNGCQLSYSLSGVIDLLSPSGNAFIPKAVIKIMMEVALFTHHTFYNLPIASARSSTALPILLLPTYWSIQLIMNVREEVHLCAYKLDHGRDRNFLSERGLVPLPSMNPPNHRIGRKLVSLPKDFVNHYNLIYFIHDR